MKSLAGLALAFAVTAAFGQGSSDCGNPFVNAFGPFDYRTATPDQRHIVESFHFTPSVESLRSGATGSIGNDLDYTLRAFPNHARALMAMIRLSQHDKTAKPKGAQYTVDCYIDRGITFRPDDITMREVRGIYFSMTGKHAQAIEDFKAVVEQQPNNGNAHYNLGLAYFEIKQYDLAKAEAKTARELKFPLDGLSRKLKSAGIRDD